MICIQGSNNTHMKKHICSKVAFLHNQKISMNVGSFACGLLVSAVAFGFHSLVHMFFKDLKTTDPDKPRLPKTDTFFLKMEKVLKSLTYD